MEEYVIPKLKDFLTARGLALNENKTHVVRQEDGFNFLGFTIRRFGKTLLTQPQKEKVKRHLKRIKAMLEESKQVKIERLIRMLNPAICGWANYYRHSAAKATYTYVAHRQWQMLWQWAKRRHPNKPSKWVKHATSRR